MFKNTGKQHGGAPVVVRLSSQNNYFINHDNINDSTHITNLINAVKYSMTWYSFDKYHVSNNTIPCALNSTKLSTKLSITNSNVILSEKQIQGYLYG